MHISRHIHTDPNSFYEKSNKVKRKEFSLFEVTRNLLKLDFGSIPILIPSSERTPCLKHIQYVISTISLVFLTPTRQATSNGPILNAWQKTDKMT